MVFLSFFTAKVENVFWDKVAQFRILCHGCPHKTSTQSLFLVRINRSRIWNFMKKMTKFAEWQPKILGLAQKRKIASILFGEAEDIISGEPDRKSGMYMYNYIFNPLLFYSVYNVIRFHSSTERVNTIYI